MKNLLEIIMPASLTTVAGAIAVCLFTLGDHLTPEPAAAEVSNCAGMGPLPEPVEQAQSLSSGADAAAVAAGDALFKGNCAQCHAVNEVIIGPALAGIRKRRPEAWIQAWVKSSGKMVARSDEYAVKIFNQYQKQQMPGFQLSDQEISQILDYVETYEARAVAYAPGQP